MLRVKMWNWLPREWCAYIEEIETLNDAWDHFQTGDTEYAYWLERHASGTGSSSAASATSPARRWGDGGNHPLTLPC
jgi:hypothetical protein